jgi:hypothetical protein
MRWFLAAFVIALAVLLSGCQRVSPLWPLKVEAAGGPLGA